jgi:hypothetical protein
MQNILPAKRVRDLGANPDAEREGEAGFGAERKATTFGRAAVAFL